MRTTIRASFVLIFAASISLMGCDKIKNAMGKGDNEGGAGSGATTTSATGGLAILNGFEGEIDLLIKGKGVKANAPINLSIEVKGDKLRADLPEGMEGTEKIGKAYGIYDSTAKKIYFVMDAEKRVIVIDLNTAGEQLKGFKGGPPGRPGAPEKPPTPPKIVKTGKTDTVAGYSCEIWEISSTDPAEKGGKAQVCIAEQGNSWFHMPTTGIPAEYAFMGELLDGKHFPLRFVGFDATGAEEGRLEVTKIDKKSMAASVFTPPAGYAQMDLGQMFGGGMGGAPGAHPGMPPGMPPGFVPPHGAPPHH